MLHLNCSEPLWPGYVSSAHHGELAVLISFVQINVLTPSEEVSSVSQLETGPLHTNPFSS